MKAPTQIQPPRNWQDFEELCEKLWGEIWHCTDTIKRNGRLGQNQCGVDVYGTPDDGIDYYGIQCKGKDSYTNSQLTTKEIDQEIEKAKKFKPQLKKFYFATTAVKDAKTEEYIRIKNVESRNSGGFGIDVFSWEDIVDKLKQNRDTYNWYINDCQYIDNSDVDVKVAGEDFKLTPVLCRSTTKYILHPHLDNPAMKQIFDLTLRMQDPSYRSLSLYTPKSINCSWCRINFRISNIGSTVLSDYHLIIEFIEGVNNFSAGRNYCDEPLINPADRAYINSKIDNERELFISKEYSGALEYRPKNTKLVQEESKTFTVSVLPNLEATKVKLVWLFLSNGYKKTGEIEIDVISSVEETTKQVFVDSKTELKPDESILGYKIKIE